MATIPLNLKRSRPNSSMLCGRFRFTCSNRFGSVLNSSKICWVVDKRFILWAEIKVFWSYNQQIRMVRITFFFHCTYSSLACYLVVKASLVHRKITGHPLRDSADNSTLVPFGPTLKKVVSDIAFVGNFLRFPSTTNPRNDSPRSVMWGYSTVHVLLNVIHY